MQRSTSQLVGRRNEFSCEGWMGFAAGVDSWLEETNILLRLGIETFRPARSPVTILTELSYGEAQTKSVTCLTL